MKKLIFTFSLIAISLFSTKSFAQALNLHRGTMIIGGEISYSTIKTIPEEGNTTTDSVVNFSPYFGYFLSQNFAFTSQIIYQETLSTYDIIGITAGLRFMQPILNFYVFVDMQGGVNRLKHNGNGDDINQFLLNAKGGILYPLNRYVAIEGGVKMQYDFNTDIADQMTISFGYFGISAFF